MRASAVSVSFSLCGGQSRHNQQDEQGLSKVTNRSAKTYKYYGLRADHVTHEFCPDPSLDVVFGCVSSIFEP